MKNILIGKYSTGFAVSSTFVSFKWQKYNHITCSYGSETSVEIPLENILNVKQARFDQFACFSPANRPDKSEIGFVLYCVKKLNFNQLTLQTWSIFTSLSASEEYTAEIKRFLALKGLNRPRSLLIFINPFGGKRQAKSIYENIVRPIFEAVDIKMSVIETSQEGECNKYLRAEDLSIFDGVVAVGGDGLVSEIIHGLLFRSRDDSGLTEDLHQPNSKEISPSLRIGLIPAGSTNAILTSIHGTGHIITSSLHIALGKSVGLDLLTTHDGDTGEFLRYIISLLGYGFHGDLLEPSEKFRFLGPSRYNLAGLLQFLKLPSYRGRISFQPIASTSSSNPLDATVCCALCPVCLKNDSDCEDESSHSPISSCHGRRQSQSFDNVDNCVEPTTTGMVDDTDRNGWQSVTGSFVAVNAFPISCRCAKSPHGPAPSAHLGDGCVDLVIVHECHHHDFLRYLILLSSSRRPKQKPGDEAMVFAKHLRLPFVEVHRVKAFRFDALDIYGERLPNNFNQRDVNGKKANSTSVWCADGEVLHLPNVSCRVHRQLLQFYGQGPE